MRDDDLFIVSYPRSGNTWMRFLLANLLAPNETITFRNIEDFVPDLHKSESPSLAARKGRRYIKSHHPLYDHYPRFIYIYRDGRDALVSYFHYLTGQRAFAGTFEDFVFSERASKFGSWKDHVTGAMEFSAVHPDRVLLLQYEGMREDTREAAAKAAKFAGLPHDDAALAEAIAKSSFEKLKAIEANFGGEKIDTGGTFFRSGESGGWRKHLSGPLYEKYLAGNAETLRRLGYSV